MNLMRFTIVDQAGSVSFLSESGALPAMVAGCATNPRTLDELLTNTEPYYQPLRGYVLNGLAIFDEHNAGGNYEVIHEALEHCPPVEMPVFRVVDEATRSASVEPVKAGIVVINLIQKRIIQIQNHLLEVGRTGAGHVYDGSGRTERTFHYKLRPEWTLVP